jgi:hypothetical protein
MPLCLRPVLLVCVYLGLSIMPNPPHPTPQHQSARPCNSAACTCVWFRKSIVLLWVDAALHPLSLHCTLPARGTTTARDYNSSTGQRGLHFSASGVLRSPFLHLHARRPAQSKTVRQLRRAPTTEAQVPGSALPPLQPWAPAGQGTLDTIPVQEWQQQHQWNGAEQGWSRQERVGVSEHQHQQQQHQPPRLPRRAPEQPLHLQAS